MTNTVCVPENRWAQHSAKEITLDNQPGLVLQAMIFSGDHYGRRPTNYEIGKIIEEHGRIVSNVSAAVSELRELIVVPKIGTIPKERDPKHPKQVRLHFKLRLPLDFKERILDPLGIDFDTYNCIYEFDIAMNLEEEYQRMMIERSAGRAQHREALKGAA